MPGPWEDYKTESAPWEDYGTPQPQMMASHTPGKRILDDRSTRKTVSDFIRPMLEGGGAVAGGLAGVPAAPATFGLSSLGGAGLGYAAGSRLADLIEGKPRTLSDAMLQSGQDVATGAAFEAGGQAAIPLIRAAAGITGKVVKPMLSTMSGTGKAVDEAIQSGKSAVGTGNPLTSKNDFDRALRGQIPGDEIVENAKQSLINIKNQRAKAYQTELSKVEAAGVHTPPLTPESTVAIHEGKLVNPQELQRSLNSVNTQIDNVMQSAEPDLNAMRNALKESGTPQSLLIQSDKNDTGFMQRVIDLYKKKINPDIPRLGNADRLNSLTADKQALESKLANLQPAEVPKELDMSQIMSTLDDLMKRYNVRIKPGNIIDTSRTAMNKSGRNDIQDAIENVLQWGKEPTDKTPLGLDTLKRQLDDFYSDSSPAREFVKTLRDSVRKTIADAVPEYDKMTKGYADATKLIKDIETDLSLKKQGMSGRITADKTLRRLMSAMRENFEMRKDIVDALSNQGGENITQQIAGYTMNPTLPRGLVGKLGAGGAAYATHLNPKMLAVVAASSPRVQGEFLRLFGRSLGELSAMGNAGQKAILMQSAIGANQ